MRLETETERLFGVGGRLLLVRADPPEAETGARGQTPSSDVFGKVDVEERIDGLAIHEGVPLVGSFLERREAEPSADAGGPDHRACTHQDTDPGGAIARGVATTARGIRGINALADVLGGGVAGGLTAETMPVQGAPSEEAYWHTKQNQATLGAGIGSTLPAIAAAASRVHVPQYFSWHHPFGSIFGPAIRGAGRITAPIAPGAPAAAATAEEERRRGEME